MYPTLLGISPPHFPHSRMREEIVYDSLLTHRSRAKGTPVQTPKSFPGAYLDTMESPYMVFRFLYKSERKHSTPPSSWANSTYPPQVPSKPWVFSNAVLPHHQLSKSSAAIAPPNPRRRSRRSNTSTGISSESEQIRDLQLSPNARRRRWHRSQRILRRLT